MKEDGVEDGRLESEGKMQAMILTCQADQFIVMCSQSCVIFNAALVNFIFLRF